MELVGIEKNGQCKVAPKPVGLLKNGTVGSADGVSDLNNGFPSDGPDRVAGLATVPKATPSMNAKFDSVWQSSRPNQAKFVAIGSKLVYLDDCSGGNSRPLHPSGVGGGHFLSPKWDDK